MRTFSLHPVVLIALIALLIVGMSLLIVVAPIMAILWLWNAVIAVLSGLPAIGIAQAGLLYLALVCVLYISDLVRVEIKAEKIN
jgi:hypothetical protein